MRYIVHKLVLTMKPSRESITVYTLRTLYTCPNYYTTYTLSCLAIIYYFFCGYSDR